MTAGYWSLAAIALALALDLAAGDPPWLPHPIRLMGRAVEKMEPLFRQSGLSPEPAGALFAGCLVGGTFLITLLLVFGAALLHPLLGFAVQILVLYTCLAPRCLYDEAMAVQRTLLKKDLQKARAQVAMLVSREVKDLDETAVTRATIETVAENFVDGVLSPLFYAALLGAPGAAAFKMASTLDSMVGYRNERYERFGKASARLDDLLNWLPARLSIPLIALAARLMLNTGRRTFKVALAEGKNHKSPNAGRAEAAFAGAMGIKINGPGLYHGQIVDKPWIGVDFGPPKDSDIEKAAHLMLLSTLLGLFAVMLLHIGLYGF